MTASLKHRLKQLELVANTPAKVDVAMALAAAIRALRDGKQPDREPTPPSWEHSKNPLAMAIYAARRRVGLI